MSYETLILLRKLNKGYFAFTHFGIDTIKKGTTKDNKTENNEVDKVMTQNPDIVKKGMKCWLFKNKDRLMNCEQFLSKKSY